MYSQNVSLVCHRRTAKLGGVNLEGIELKWHNWLVKIPNMVTVLGARKG